MNINYLKSFITVTKHLNFSKAAEELYITQPALTKQIKDLEKELGSVLLDRTTRTMKLSPSGEICLKYAKQILQSIDCMEEEIDHINASRVERLKIGYITRAHTKYIKEGLKEITKRHPNAEINVEKVIPASLINQLRTGELDCGFLHLPSVKNQGLAYRTVKKGGVVVRVPSDSVWASKKKLTVDDIKDELIITGKNVSPESFRFTTKCFEKFHVKPRVFHANNEESIEILMNTMNAISLTSEFSPEITGYVNRRIIGFEQGFDLVLARNKENTNPLLDEFQRIILTYNN